MRCGWVRREVHDWDVKNGCKCKRCGIRDHDWDGCKCKRCGWKRDKGHIWDGVICRRCGWEKGKSGEADVKHTTTIGEKK